jgi:class 3 adenylate cyclase
VPSWSLRTRLLVATSAILVALIGSTLFYVGTQATALVRDRVAADLGRTREQIRADEGQRHASLQVTAQVLASFPELRALLATDTATIRDVLLEYQERVGGIDLLVVLDPSGVVLARTDALSPAPVADAERRWVAPALAGQPAVGLLTAESGMYEAAATASAAGGSVFGFILVGTRIDDGLARRLRDASRDDVVLIGDAGVLGSTIEARRWPWASLEAWDATLGARGDAIDIDLGGERFAAIETRGRSGPALRYVSLQSRDRALAPYRHIQWGLFVLGLAGILLGVAASAWLARSVTQPLVALTMGTKRVAAGEYDVTLDERRGDELGRLARAFNQMTRGLRERADMQQFVSQSTVAMIQSDRPQTVSSGERRRLTILISDIRGFTSFADTRPPEAVVARLNQCLGSQASRVKKFGGDIDKYVGDSVVALFDGDDMALRAIRCAIDIHRAIDALDDADASLQVGIGIATGDVILGSIGGEGRLDYTAIGAHVNLASRLCGQAAGREILIAASTYDDVRDLVAAEPLTPMAIRGFHDAVQIYRMTVAR